VRLADQPFPATIDQARQAGTDAGYDQDDAWALVQVWRWADVDAVTAVAGLRLLDGEELPLRPRKPAGAPEAGELLHDGDLRPIGPGGGCPPRRESSQVVSRSTGRGLTHSAERLPHHGPGSRCTTSRPWTMPRGAVRAVAYRNHGASYALAWGFTGS
jgi:hypothetical protein